MGSLLEHEPGAVGFEIAIDALFTSYKMLVLGDFNACLLFFKLFKFHFYFPISPPKPNFLNNQNLKKLTDTP